MVRSKKKLFASLFAFLTLITFSSYTVLAQTTPTPTTSSSTTNKDELSKRIAELEAKVAETRAQKNSLASQIEAMDNQIQLTEYRINATQQEITELGMDIDTAGKKMENLDSSLSKVSQVLINRIVAKYQAGDDAGLSTLLSADNISDLFTRSSYLQIVQEHDKKVLFAAQQARNDYANQKEIFETKKKKIESLKVQLEGYTAQLDKDKATKESFLQVTKNDEKQYQSLLEKARAEYAAIQSIVAGNGAESASGAVSEGARIASVIPGASCNSSGGHLHFIVSRNGATQNPFSSLKAIDHRNCSGSSCGSGDGDSFNPSGSWEWPLNGPITMYQGYGSTWAVRNTWAGRIYSSHNGIDIVGSSYEVKAVKSGTLYRGSYSGSGGCRLPYVRVRHDDGLDTFYLHVYY